MQVFLFAPQLFENLCGIARTLEVFGITRCFVYDKNRLIRERYGRSRTRQAKAASAGAFSKIAFERVEDPLSFIGTCKGRVIATVPTGDAVPLGQFEFRKEDTIMFGSESYGLPPELVTSSSARVTLPRRGVTESLNLSVCVGIVVHEVLRQLA